jgi:two-component system KDP operon response regulator KdpE
VSRPIAVLVDDSARGARGIAALLRRDRLSVVVVRTGSEAVALAAIATPDIYLVNLHGESGAIAHTCRELRRRSQAPIIAVARRAPGVDPSASAVGADACVLVRPGGRELLECIRERLARHRAESPSDTATVKLPGGIRLNLDQRVATRAGAPIRLSTIQWAILAVLIGRLNRPVTLSAVVNAVWGVPLDEISRRRLRVHMTYLRRRLETPPADPRAIVTLSGYGYRLAGELGPVSET